MSIFQTADRKDYLKDKKMNFSVENRNDRISNTSSYGVNRSCQARRDNIGVFRLETRRKVNKRGPGMGRVIVELNGFVKCGRRVHFIFVFFPARKKATLSLFRYKGVICGVNLTELLHQPPLTLATILQNVG